MLTNLKPTYVLTKFDAKIQIGKIQPYKNFPTNKCLITLIRSQLEAFDT